jgi:hypothetical protein
MKKLLLCSLALTGACTGSPLTPTTTPQQGPQLAVDSILRVQSVDAPAVLLSFKPGGIYHLRVNGSDLKLGEWSGTITQAPVTTDGITNFGTFLSSTLSVRCDLFPTEPAVLCTVMVGLDGSALLVGSR